MLLYDQLAPAWYRIIDPPEDHRDEAAAYADVLKAAAPVAETLLELGSGAGHNAFHLKRRFLCTLTDVSEPMLALSRDLNPECEHALGDMRDLRLGRLFDCVLVHDAIMYMLSEQDLQAAITTAFTHTRPGGAAVFAPDVFRETFQESSDELRGEDGGRVVRGLDWMWDPDPSDDTFVTEYALLLREGGVVTAVHDRHVEGLFSTATWRRLLLEAGYAVATFDRPTGDGEFDQVFICMRPVPAA
jgi:SAM-dependent methyltransferase